MIQLLTKITATAEGRLGNSNIYRMIKHNKEKIKN